MFGMGFFEICVVIVIAIIFLGPEKLPKAMVDLAKFLKTIKKTMDDAKSSIDKELNLSELKQEALQYKSTITQEFDHLKYESNINELNSILDPNSITQDSKDKQDKQQLQDKINQESLKQKQAHLSLNSEAKEINYKSETKES